MRKVFFTKVASVTDNYPRQDIHIVLGDFNVVSGSDRAGNKHLSFLMPQGLIPAVRIESFLETLFVPRDRISGL